jgi:hypothetical protein
MGVIKQFKLDDGSITTVAEVMQRTGLAYAGSVDRLRLYTNPVQVYEPRKQQGIPKGTTLKRPKEWVNEPDKVCAGIPYDCSYMDGILDGAGFVYDRHGKRMSARERKSLANYRGKLRQQWLNNREVIK